MLLKDRVCLVTGASRGIGAGIVECFVAEGATVYANARATSCLDQVCKALTEMGPGEAIPVYFDVRNTGAIKECVMRIKKERSRLDVLVNNAGVMKDAMLGMISDNMIEETFSTNVVPVIQGMQYAAKLMVRQGGGSIINIASIVGVVGNKNQVLYSASKGAVIAMTKSAAKELAPHHIRVNAIAPGVVDTDLFNQIGPEKVGHLLSSVGMGRVAMPKDIAGVCLFLASDMSSYVTGEVIRADGALVM